MQDRFYCNDNYGAVSCSGHASASAAVIGIDEDLYRATASALYEAIGGDNYFSGSVEIEGDRFHSVLTVSVVVYRGRMELPEGTVHAIVDLVPVWWEFSTTLPDGDEVLNDFSFAELKRVFLAA